MRYCPLVSLMICCVSSLCLAAPDPSTLKNIPIPLPNQPAIETPEDDSPLHYAFDGQPADKQADKNWFIAGGLHYTVAEAKEKQDSRKSRCHYYQQLQPQAQAIAPPRADGYAYSDFVRNEISFFCGTMSR